MRQATSCGVARGKQRAVLFRHRGEAFTLSRATISDGCFELEKLAPRASGRQIVPGLLVGHFIQQWHFERQQLIIGN